MSLKIVFDASGNTRIGVTVGHQSLKLIRKESEEQGDGTDELEAW